MYPDKSLGDSICGSQNFCLKLSQDSNISEIIDTNDDNDIVVISDSSSKSTCSTPDYHSKSSAHKYSAKSDKVYILESSDSETTDIDNDKAFQAWKANKKESHINYYQERRNDIKKNTVIYTSDESSSTSGERVTNYVSSSNKTSSSYITATTQNSVKSTLKRNIQSPSNHLNETDLISSCTTSVNTAQTVKTPSSASTVHNNLSRNISRQDARNIMKNIKSTKIVYESPRAQKPNNSMLHKDTATNIKHPAISPTNVLTMQNVIIDETLIDSESDVVPGSQVNVENPYKTHVSKFLKASHVEKAVGTHTELSDRKKKQISQWLMTNSPESQSDSSFSIVPPSNRCDTSSGNSSLERLEMNYETPNNRDKIRQQVNQKGMRNLNCNEAAHTTIHATNTPRQATINEYIQRSKNNGLELSTSAKKKSHAVNSMFSTPTANPTNAAKNIDIQDCTEILDKLYGKAWRDKADVFFANSEPRKQPISTKNRAVQTERKLISKGRLYLSDSDDDSNSSLTDLKLRHPSTKKNVRKNTKQQDSFINDEVSSESGGESLYQTALTHPRVSTNSDQVEPKVPPSTRRVLAICDSDSEDEANKNNNHHTSDVRRRKLSFSDDESDDSGTSEFDPGDDVPPKSSVKKAVGQTSKVNKQTNPTLDNKRYGKQKSFLESLSESVPIAEVHPDAKKYRLDFKNNKESLCNYLYKLYNEKVFDKNLPEDMSIEWNIRMRGTAGFCYNKKSVKTLGGIIKSSRIVLSTKVLDTPDRLRDTLIHEMCHAAAWLINDVSDGHGPFWTGWANKAMKTFPELPPIRRCHDYKIKTKFTYKCVGCGYSIGRHSKSLDIEKKRCGHCYGKFELLLNKTTKAGTVQVQTPKREPSAFALYVKENYNSVKRERNIKHGEVMKILGQQFSAIKIAKRQENNEDDPDNSG